MMNMLISKAIPERRLIRFGYKGSARVVEPHTYGPQANGAEALRAWQLSGGSAEQFRLFRCDEIESVQLMDDIFSAPSPGYREGIPTSSWSMPNSEI